MQRWLAHELCAHRDPSLARFFTGMGARGLFDLSGNRRHLTVETNGLSSGFAGISNNNKQGLTFAPKDWYQDGGPDNPLRKMHQRYFDPKGSTAINKDIAFGVNDEFTVLCWVYGNNEANGPLISLQGRHLVDGSTFPYGVRGWSFGVIGNTPLLSMYSHAGIGGTSLYSYDDFGYIDAYADFMLYDMPGIQQWTHIGAVYRGRDIPWGVRYSGSGDSSPTDPNFYQEDIAPSSLRRDYLTFFRNGAGVRGPIENSQSNGGQVDVRKTSSFTPGNLGDLYVSGMRVTQEAVLHIGGGIVPNFANYTSPTEIAYEFCQSPACLFRIYNRALTNKEVKAIYDREQFLFQYRPFQDWAADEAKGLSFFMSGSDSRSTSMTLYAGTSDEINQSLSLATHGNGMRVTGTTLYAGSGDERNASISMYCDGLGVGISAIPLYAVNAQGITSQNPFYAIGGTTSTQSIPLFTNGVFAKTDGIPLFAAADSIPSLNANVPLSLFGSTHQGVTKGIPLFAFADTDANKKQVGIPLFVQAVTQSRFSVLMNMFASGEAHTAKAGVDMVAWNNQLGLSKGITLFVRGDGVTDGAVPLGKGLNLVLKRDPAAAMPLFAQAPGEQLGTGTTLYVYGVVPNHASVDMAVPDVVGLLVSPVKLYTTGF